MSAAAIINSARELTITETATTPLSSREVRVDVAYCGVCGSDLHMFFDAPEPLVGQVLGHEFSGVITEVGPDVAGWSIGDRVVIRPIDECGTCAACRAEDAVCMNGLMCGPGLGRPGGLAQSVALPCRMLRRVPDHLSLRDAALTEPLAVAVRGVERARLAPDDAIIVAGAGPVGLLTLAVLQARGSNRILVAEPNAQRRDVAARRGAHTVEPSGLAAAANLHFADGVAAVIDCSGHPDCAQQAVDVVGYGARIVIVGIPTAPSQLSLLSVAIKEVSIVGSAGYSERNFADALALLASGQVNADEFVTSVLSLDEIDSKLHELISGESADIKVLVSHRVDREPKL